MGKTLPSQRYALLVHQLGDELGKTYGWQSRVSRRLGVSHVVVNRIVRMERATVGLDVIHRAIRRLRLDSRFFYDASLGECPDYREYARGRMEADPTEVIVNDYLAGEGAALPEAVQERLRMLYIDGIEVTPDIVRAVADRLLIQHAQGEAPGRQTRVVKRGSK